METEIFAVWYACVGCLPDSGEPEYVGTWKECIEYVNSPFRMPTHPHDLYRYSIEPWEENA